jgi:putative acetyltransferase
MSVTIREMRPEEARAFLEVHHSAVRGLATADYPPEVIEAWAPWPITDEHVDFVRSNAEGEYRLVAENGGRIVGIGCLVARKKELRACYVLPSASRNGVGTAILRALEHAARDQGATALDVDASLNAEAFYRSRGYEVCGRGEHVLNSGARMACLRMRKDFGSRGSGRL